MNTESIVKTVLLLTPAYISLFWSLLLNFAPGPENAAKRFLGKFMLACIVIYTTHFLYYSNLAHAVRYIEPLYQFCSLSVYPLFYIYFRLLMNEKRFSWSKHGPVLILPAFLSLIYLAAFSTVQHDAFLNWLYYGTINPAYPALFVLSFLRKVIALVFVVQAFATVFANLRLINSHRKRAGHYFSDLWEIRSLNVVMLNVFIVICGLTSITLSLLGRQFFNHEIMGIAWASFVFSSTLFTIGWMGVRQKVLNPAFEDVLPEPEAEMLEEITVDHRKLLLTKICNLFKEEKIHLNNKLTIQDVAQSVGTNRTYVSSIINQHFGVNFCTFVNNYRIEELENMLKNHPELTNQILAENCGFGSVDSLKRAVNAKTGLSVTEWKNDLRRSGKNLNL